MTKPSVPPDRTPWPSSRTVLATVAVIFLLYFGHAFFVPIAIALLFNILSRPLVRWLERRGVGAPIGATLVVILALVGLGAAGMGLTVPVKTWVAKAPESMAAARDRLARFRKPVQQLDSAAAQLQSGGRGARPGGPGSESGSSSSTAPRPSCRAAARRRLAARGKRQRRLPRRRLRPPRSSAASSAPRPPWWPRRSKWCCSSGSCSPRVI